MEIDPKLHYRMPLVSGPLFSYDNLPRVNYPEIDELELQYLTDADAIGNLLPKGYQPAKEPLVTILFNSSAGLGFLGGRGYRLATVQVAARFDGQIDHQEGDYIVVMYENDTMPITAGREDLGVPKVFGDISGVRRMPDGRLKCEVSRLGHLMFGVELAPGKKQTANGRRDFEKKVNERFWMGHKYIASLDGPPDADYPTIYKKDTKIEELWLSTGGSMYYGDAGFEDIVFDKTIIDALKTLPVRTFVQGFRLKGSMVLRYDLARRLR